MMRTRNTTASVIFSCACLSVFVAVRPPKPEPMAATRRRQPVPRKASGAAIMLGFSTFVLKAARAISYAGAGKSLTRSDEHSYIEFIVAVGRIHGAILRDNIVAGTVLRRTRRARG